MIYVEALQEISKWTIGIQLSTSSFRHELYADENENDQTVTAERSGRHKVAD